jgi:dihydroorotase
MSCLAHIFEQADALANLEAFTSLNGPAFYRLPPNDTQINLIRRDHPVTYPEARKTPDGDVTIFDCGVPLYWDVETAD